MKTIRTFAGVLALLPMATAHADWVPTFVDNFEGTSLDRTAWVSGREILPRRIQFYDPDAVAVSDGKLKLSVLHRSESDRPYTAGTVTTQGLFKQQYGYFEIRARAPRGNGYWPAFWLMPETGRWTSEIDIAEFRGHLTDTVHYGFHYDFSLQNQNGFTAAIPVDAADTFNNYAVHWTPERIDFLFNGDLMHSIVGTETVAQADDEMFMLLNVAIASQHSGWIPTVDRDTDLSGVYEIEHVRVFQEVANGPYAEIPPHTTPIADIRVPSYDNTALDVDRVGGGPGSDIFRAPVPVTGSLEVTAHRPDYSGRVSVILSEMSNFNNSDGRFDKSPAIEEIVFDVQLDNVGDTQQLDYQFETAVSLPAVYSVDVLIKDLPTNNKKSLASNRVVQFLDVNQPGTTAFFEGFLREMTASFDSGQVTAEVPLQLQQAMLTPYLSVTYELVDTYSTDVLHVEEAMVEHDQVGMIALDTVIEKELDVEQSVALIVSVSDASGSFVLPRWGVHIEGTAPPPPGWTPDSGPVNPPVGGGTIPQLRWNATFVDNFDGPSLNPSAWIPNRDHIARRLQYYDKDALVLRDGHLDISVLNRPESDRPYTSGTVSTQGLFKQQFGYFEVRARIPKGNGFWPAFWLMPESGQWTSEIDIAEFRGQLPDNVHHAYHYGFRLRNENGRTVALNGDLSASYNNFAVYWTPERIDYLFNDVIVHSVTEATAVANANSEMYLILNLALSSHHASEWIPTVSEDTDLGQAFSIDYVRVYTADENGEYDGIPAFDAVVPDRQTPSYDNTALAVDRVDDPSYPDLLRSPQRIGGALELTSHRDNFDGLVTVMLVPVIEFNPDDGRFTKGPAVDTRNIPVALAAQGDQLILDYEFEPVIDAPGVYSVDVIVRDTPSNNKRTFTAHRFVQYVDVAQRDTTVFFEGFFGGAAALYRDGRMRTFAHLQLQQSLLSPYVLMNYQVLDVAADAVVFTETVPYVHDKVGFHPVNETLNVTLDPSREYELIVNATDSSGTHVISGVVAPVRMPSTSGTTPPVTTPGSDGGITLPVDPTLPVTTPGADGGIAQPVVPVQPRLRGRTAP